MMPESAFSIDRIRRSDSAGIAVHLGPARAMATIFFIVRVRTRTPSPNELLSVG
jgi:hypothetical protein